MFKFCSKFENVAEKMFSWLLPQIEAQASCGSWRADGCCGPGGSQMQLKRYCFPPGAWEYNCTGICPD